MATDGSSPEEPLAPAITGAALDEMATNAAVANGETLTNQPTAESTQVATEAPSRRGVLASLSETMKKALGLGSSAPSTPEQPAAENAVETPASVPEVENTSAPSDSGVSSVSSEVPTSGVESTDPLAALIAEQAPNAPAAGGETVPGQTDSSAVSGQETNTAPYEPDMATPTPEAAATSVEGNIPVKPLDASASVPVPTEVPQQVAQSPITADLPTPVPSADAPNSPVIVEPGATVTPLPTTSEGGSLPNIPTPSTEPVTESGVTEVPQIPSQPIVPDASITTPRPEDIPSAEPTVAKPATTPQDPAS